MQFIEYYTEGEERNGCLGAEWLFTLGIAWLLPSIASLVLHTASREEIKIQSLTECVSLLYCCKVEKL